MNPENENDFASIHEEQLMDYLYGEMSNPERESFEKTLSQDAALNQKLKSYLQLRQMAHQHLPKQEAPKHLTKAVLSELGLGRRWYHFDWEVFWRPSLVGAFLLLLTVGVGVRLQNNSTSTQVATTQEKPAQLSLEQKTPEQGSFAKKFPDQLSSVASNQMWRRPRVAGPSWGIKPRSNFATNVGYGDSAHWNENPVLREAQMQRLEIEAKNSIAKFNHQQALSLRAMGDFSGAAEVMARLIKEHPFYPLKLQVMAQRIDCLFQAGELTQAKQEMKVIEKLSPAMAYSLERRWGKADS